ncbi:MAG: hypothetical protein ABC596_09565 [Candidatus Methanosuratincola petrocarbonis]
MIRSKSPSTIFLGIAGITLVVIGFILLSGAVPGMNANYGGLPSLDQLLGRSGATLTITGSLVNAKTGETVATWEAPQGPLAIMFGNTRIDVPDGEYELHFQPKWTVTVANVSGASQYTVKVEVTSVSQKWKTTVLNDITPIGVSNAAEKTAPVSNTTMTLECAKRVFGCGTAVNNPPPVGGSADYTITYSYKVSLYVDGALVDSKVGTATATATFRNTGPSGTLSAISVTVSPVTQYVPFNIGYF